MIGMSDIYIVACRTAPNVISSIAVPLHSPGLSFGANERKMGWKSQPTRVVRFDAVRVPKDHLYVFFPFVCSFLHLLIGWGRKEMVLKLR